ncbi:hypothetical protein GGTG_11505 [Gaeumannomyces tritici R3-111a-1]|uniref:Uncharacterized protein n=1 Tax=Gaeumannomyces tritici (strain R3-111a-1) TaxID=644352 RepID=J3PDD7_GAET3|nr:hypothetical protein GGTG_11505 [Gaeumannomyces tritici R3-111a-1]EJT70482.1 hypothetical protein GGTG_11505 [Gaeumannomyces tritici R3-111a-1]
MTRSIWGPPPPSSLSSSVTSSPARASAGSDALLMIDADKGEAASAAIEDLRARLAAAEERLSALEKSTTTATAMTTTATTTKDERDVDRPRTRWEEMQELIRLGFEKSRLARYRNRKVGTATGRLLPIYSNATGKEIELCPKSFEELRNMGSM